MGWVVLLVVLLVLTPVGGLVLGFAKLALMLGVLAAATGVGAAVYLKTRVVLGGQRSIGK